MAPSRQLILGTAFNYGPAELEVFAKSLRQGGYLGDVALFTGGLDAQTQAFFTKYNFQAISFSPRLLHPRWRHVYATFARWTADKKGRADLWQLYEHWLPINSARFIAYYKFLLANAKRYDEFLFADVRDVFFQKNPFSLSFESELTLFEEYKTLTIGSCRYNRGWIKDGYGEKVLNEMQAYTVICAGITYARGEAVLRYTGAVVDELVRTNSHRNLDQGVHNFLARHPSEYFPQAKIFTQAEALVLNIACTPNDQLTFNADGQMTNGKGEVATIVHQYDRHPEVAQKLLSQLKS